MARNSEGYTPRTLAYDILIGWAAAAAKGQTDDVARRAPNGTFEKKTRQQLAKLHNRLLARSGLHGMDLDEEDPK